MTMQADNLVRRIDLQLFGEGDPPAQESPAEPAGTAQEPGQPGEEPQPKSLLEFFNRASEEGGTEEKGTGEGEPTTEPESRPEEPKLEIPEKFRLPDGSLNQEALLRSYLEEEKKLHEQAAELAEIRKMMQELQGRLLQEQPKEPETPQLTEEQIQELNEKWLSEFYSNPLQAINQILEPLVQSRIQPLAQQIEQQRQVEQWTQQVETVRQKYSSDFDQLLPEMEKIVQEQGEALVNIPNAVEVIYQMAKARHYKPPEELLKDENFRKKILEDESIRNEILKDYANKVKEGQPPIMVGSQPGEIPAIPPEEIKTPQDSLRATKSFFQRILGKTQ